MRRPDFLSAFLFSLVFLTGRVAGAQGLYLETRGSSGPAVVFEAGIGGDTTAWAPVADAVARFARVVLYDRAGLGRSTLPPDTPADAFTADGATRALRARLVAAGIRPPYILVGHSLGGLYMQRFAQRYPDDVAGLVLVDSSLSDPASMAQRDNPNPPGTMIYREREGMLASREQVAGGGPLPPVPLIVIAAGKRDAQWLERQRRLAGRSPRSTFIVAEGAGHDVQFDRPGVVIEAIRSLAVPH
jgi:pimeloyl-ACP methyl ester carboxylesterase